MGTSSCDYPVRILGDFLVARDRFDSVADQNNAANQVSH